MTRKKSSVDMTQGSISNNIFRFALPIFVSSVFQNLYNSVDSIVVGRFVGKIALAAVNSCADISMLLTGFFTGLSTGAGVLFSRYFGGKRYDDLHKALHTTLAASIIFAIVLAVAGIAASPLILDMIDCPADVYLEAETYLRIYLIGILFTALYNVGSGVLRAVGDSKSPFYYLITSSLINIVLDLVFVIYFNMGTLGVAFATIIAQFVSVVLVAVKMIRTDDVYKLVIDDLKIDFEMLKEIVRFGIPAALQASVFAVSNLFVQKYINYFGSDALAGIGTAKKIDKFIGLTSQAIGLSMSTFVSQNIGANNKQRAFEGIKVANILGFVAWILIATPVYIFAREIVMIFTTDENAIAYGVAMIRTMAPFYYFMTLNQVYSNAVRGFGYSLMVMILSIIGIVVTKQVYLALMMHYLPMPFHVYISYPIGWVCSAILVYLYYFFKIKRDNI